MVTLKGSFSAMHHPSCILPSSHQPHPGLPSPRGHSHLGLCTDCSPDWATGSSFYNTDEATHISLSTRHTSLHHTHCPAHIWVPIPRQAFTPCPQADPGLHRLLWGPCSI